MKKNRFSKKGFIINILIGSAYLILIGLLIFSISRLSSLYYKEEMDMISSVENRFNELIVLEHHKDIEKGLDELVEIYNFDVVITSEKEILYKSIPYEIGDSLLNRVNDKNVARVYQDTFEYNDDLIYIWYTVYHLSDSVFVNSFLRLILFLVFLVTILLGLTSFLISKTLFSPLKNIKESLQLAQDYEFNKIKGQDDTINQNFKSFISTLESNIDGVTREHTQLEKQLQAKREHLNNILLVSRSMVHDLKTPIHRNILENEAVAKDALDNEGVQMLAKLNQNLNHDIMTDVNRILTMLKNEDGQTTIKIEEINLTETLLRSLNSFKRNMKSKNLSLDLVASDDIVLTTEGTSFILLINNLLSNMILYAKEDSEISIYIDQNINKTRLRFSNLSDSSNIDKMKDTEKLFNAIKNPEGEGYIYRSGNGLYLIKELSQMLNAEYHLKTSDCEVLIEVVFNHEEV